MYLKSDKSDGALATKCSVHVAQVKEVEQTGERFIHVKQ